MVERELSFNSIEWILCALVRVGGVAEVPFNSIEWIHEPKPNVTLLSNGLSIPLNGFEVRGNLQHGEEAGAFNSIEWIPVYRGVERVR